MLVLPPGYTLRQRRVSVLQAANIGVISLRAVATSTEATLQHRGGSPSPRVDSREALRVKRFARPEQAAFRADERAFSALTGKTQSRTPT